MCLDRAIDALRRAIGFGEEAVVEIVSGAACLRKEWEVS
jgi:hypothetical protein